MEATQGTFAQTALTQETPVPSQQAAVEVQVTGSNVIMRQLIQGIVEHGYAVIPGFLSSQQTAQLAAEARQLQEDGAMRRAGTGKALDQEKSSIRGDVIHWLEENIGSQAQQHYLQHMETLREAFNRELFLGLYDLESHFAIYPPGAFYQRHLDQFHGNTQRQVSTILYLNDDWRNEYGGQLRIYLDGTADGPYLDIEPVGGTLVAFLSGRFYHEVLPASKERLSITGWFKTRSHKPV